MATSFSIRDAALRSLLPVRNLDDLNRFVEECELIEGSTGRLFVVAGADRPAFRVQIDPAGYEIMRVDQDESIAAPLRTTAPELGHHTLGNALMCGLLYTSPLLQ